MQHHGAADAGAEALGVGGNGDQGFGCHPHQDGQYRLAIGVGQFGDRLRQREHDMEIRRRQYALELLVKPPTRAGALACAAMAIPARVVQDARHLALFAVVQARTHRRGATVDDGVEHAPRSSVEQVARIGRQTHRWRDGRCPPRHSCRRSPTNGSVDRPDDPDARTSPR